MGSGSSPMRNGRFGATIVAMMSGAEPVTAHVELVLEPDGVRGVLRAQHTPELPFSGWLGLAVAVDQCRRAAEDSDPTPEDRGAIRKG
jgi:hypothetical protein